MINDNNYLTIPSFLRTKLNLKGSELIVSALIYGFTQDGESWFKGSTDYISEWVGITNNNSLKCLTSLVEKGVLLKEISYVNNRAKRCYYKFNFLCVAEHQNSGVAEHQNSGVAEHQNSGVLYNSKDNNSKDNNAENKISGSLFPELENIEKEKKIKGTSEKLCEFVNSRFYDYELFKKQFQKIDFEKIDIYFYYCAVMDWSARTGKKQKDWIATARSFMRTDTRNNKLKLKPEYQKNTGISKSAAIDYLNNDY